MKIFKYLLIKQILYFPKFDKTWSYLLKLSKVSIQRNIELRLQQMNVINRTVRHHRIRTSRSVQLWKPVGCYQDPIFSPAEQLKIGHPSWKTFRDKPKKNILFQIYKNEIINIDFFHSWKYITQVFYWMQNFVSNISSSEEQQIL